MVPFLLTGQGPVIGAVVSRVGMVRVFGWPAWRVGGAVVGVGAACVFLWWVCGWCCLSGSWLGLLVHPARVTAKRIGSDDPCWVCHFFSGRPRGWASWRETAALTAAMAARRAALAAEALAAALAAAVRAAAVRAAELLTVALLAAGVHGRHARKRCGMRPASAAVPAAAAGRCSC